MSRGTRRLGNRPTPLGVWLAFLALVVQTLLPLLVGVEIGLINAAEAQPSTLCLAGGEHGGDGNSVNSLAPPVHDQSRHGHSLADGCPLCLALAAGHVFTASDQATFTPPTSSATIVLHAVHAPGRTSFAAASYNPRAPPSSI